MITIKNYVEKLFNDVNNSTEKDNIKQKIILNLKEKVQDLIEDGKLEEDAINKAIVDFGDIDEIKMNLPYATHSEYTKRPVKITNRLLFALCGSVLIIA